MSRLSEPSAWCRVLGNYSSPHVAVSSIDRSSRDVFPSNTDSLFSAIAPNIAIRTLLVKGFGGLGIRRAFAAN
jgi:hypothetical protein